MRREGIEKVRRICGALKSLRILLGGNQPFREPTIMPLVKYFRMKG